MKDAMEALRELAAGRTFDDFLFSPQSSVVERRDPASIDLSAVGGGGCADVQNDARVKVTGTRDPSGTVTATAVNIQKKAKR